MLDLDVTLHRKEFIIEARILAAEGSLFCSGRPVRAKPHLAVRRRSDPPDEGRIVVGERVLFDSHTGCEPATPAETGGLCASGLCA